MTPRGPAAVLVAAGVAAACSLPGGGTKVEPEVFGSTDLHARNLESHPQQACEAARRALLSQGFAISVAAADRVIGRKNFQPRSETHVEIELSVVCAPEGRGGRQTTAFVSAVQDQYALKKSNNSASVGVPILGSLSLPIISSDDAMVKVASETISSPGFYDRFYRLLDRYLEATLGVDGPEPELTPVATAAAAAGTAASAAAWMASTSQLAASGAAPVRGEAATPAVVAASGTVAAAPAPVLATAPAASSAASAAPGR